MAKYEIGKIGLSGEEIRAELEEINSAICKRNPKDCNDGIGFSYLATPGEIHRRQVLRACQMANSCLVYDDDYGWKHNAVPGFTAPIPVIAHNPKFECNDEQKEAFRLSREELDAVYAAQKLRLKRATVVRDIVTDEDGFSYSGVRW